MIEIPEFLKREIQNFVERQYGLTDDERLFPIVQESFAIIESAGLCYGKNMHFLKHLVKRSQRR